MQTSNHHPESIPSVPPRAPLRLLLSDTVGGGVLDGAWWPRSRNLQDELADLVGHFPAKAGRIVHAVYSRPNWQPAQRRVKVAGGVVKVGSFPRDDTHQILLGMANRQVIHLMVVAAETSSKAAHRLMRLASTSTNRDSASTLLENARTQEAAESEGADSAARRDDDGAEWWEPRSVLPARRARE